jgi:hypothetical protein
MATGSQPVQDSHRTIVLRERGAELLLVPTECGLVLPCIEIPRWQRVAWNLTGALKRTWGCEAICLSTPEATGSSDGPQPLRCQVMECCHDSETPKRPATWTVVSSLSADSFANSADYIALQRSLDQVFKPADSSRPFVRLGWFEELQAWVKQVIHPLGIELTGNFSQFNACPSFSLIRFETTGPALWFKAVGEPNGQEFSITMSLAERFPRYLPTVIASRPAWHGWLMKDGGAAMADSLPRPEQWQEVAADLARLQLESIGHAQWLLAVGTKDLRIPRLQDLVDPFLDTMVVLMERQPKASPPALSSQELCDLRRQLHHALDILQRSNFPVTLGHTDFNPGNILRGPRGSVFIDWAEAHVGHPFLTFEYLLSHLHRDCPEVAAFEDFIRTAYTQTWRYCTPAQSIAEAAVVSPLIAVFAYAVSLNSWHSPESHDQPAYLRSLTRRMKREADQIDPRRMPCLQC